tara:strand:- start:1283 stop:2422 length:1140 start_codon:yes stop_codon:yes gene_type:complete
MSNTVPEEFKKVVKDFYRDVLTTFPECKDKLGASEVSFLTGESDDAVILYSYCKKVYPERFFDILYQNQEIFEEGSNINTKFLPNIDFKKLWKEDISEKTRDVIWKYLQLILFSVSNGLDSQESFGDTAKLFEAINEDELKSKLEETMKEMNQMFKDASDNMFKDLSGDTFDMSGINMENMPNPEEMQDHINGLLGGKLGRLAHEIAEETASELNVDMEDANNVSDVFQKLFKNPGKLINMVKKVGSKLDSKLKSGEIKESELMEEASELMEKMKNMPGMKNMDKILGKMGLPTGGKNSKVSMGAFQAQMRNNIGKAKQKERMLRKLEERKRERELLAQQNQKQYTTSSWGDNEKIEKSSRNGNIKKRKKKKKNKKKKN